MTNKSKIEWTDTTKNPIHLVKPDSSHGGHWCNKISEGCLHCYAEHQNQSNYLSWASHLKYTGDVPENLILDENILVEIIKMKTPKKIFMCSMTDLFGNWIFNDWIDKIFATMLIAKQHTFQVLTKRPQRMKEYLSKPYHINIARYIDEYFDDKFAHQNYDLPAPNIWLGVTCENQRTANERIPILLETPAKVRFLSCEPLLEEIKFNFDNGKPDWIIVGGESGNKARPCHLDWIRSTVKQCRASNVPIFVKQLGSNVFYGAGNKMKLSRKGGDISKFPEDLQLREFPLNGGK